MRYHTSPEMLSGRPEPLFNRLPPVVLMLTALITIASSVQLLSQSQLFLDRWVAAWMFDAGAIAGGPEFDGVYRPLGNIAPLILHVFLHGGIFHLAMNMMALVAFGPPVAIALGIDRKGAFAFLLFFAGCAISGALFQIGWSEFTGQSELAIGASSALSGFLPAVGWLRGGLKGAVRISVPWIVINLVIAVVGEFMASIIGIRLAWAAHIGGVAGGIVLFPLMLAVFNTRLWRLVKRL
ncbi:rhomboid family intramembrane serine protease [Henriciella sp.]|uniref:rhomboid family intramembrane serine protease n=1 Tax=Henriciella sp. TaxID=1968823 RepID=UPI001848AF99|nr:rhomboid family intramembrane serine protease [Henriciella sp.]HIG23519.1 rhomboid family intramembrane serine protease [Henriciella sp.]